MSGKFRRIIALLLTVVMATTSIISCGNDNVAQTSGETKKAYLSRGQWITMLAEAYGMVEYNSEAPYYSDVTSEHEIFPYVQSSYEWNVLSRDSAIFKPDDIATVGFVVSTAVLAAELDYEQFISDGDVNEGIIKCANEYEITSITCDNTDLLRSAIEEFDAITVLNASVEAFNTAQQDEVFDIEYTENVVDATTETLDTIQSVGTNPSVAASDASQVEAGSIILMPETAEYPFGYCMKVTSKTLNQDGTYTIVTEKPEIYEVFETIDIDASISATADMFEPAEGVTILSTEQASNGATNLDYTTASYITDLSNLDNKTLETDSHTYTSKEKEKITFGISFNNKGKLKASFTSEWADNAINSLKLKIKNPDIEKLSKVKKAFAAIGKVEDKLCATNDYSFVDDYINGKITDKELEKKLKQAQKDIGCSAKSQKGEGEWESGWEVTGQLAMETSVNVEAQINFNCLDTIPTELEKFSVSVVNNTESSLEIKGTYNETFPLGTYTIPLGAGFGLKLKAEIFLDYNGAVTFKYTIDNTTEIAYTDGVLTKKNTQTSSPSIEAATELEFGIDLSGTLTVWGIGLAELGAKISTKLKTSSSVERALEYEIVEDNGQPCFLIRDVLHNSESASIYIPLVTFYLGGDNTLLGWIGVEVEYSPLTEDNTKEIKIVDYSSKEAGDPFVLDEWLVPINEETTEEQTTEEITEETTTAEENSGAILSLSEFAVALSVGEALAITADIPSGYSFSDLIWSVTDSSVVSVSNGTITALGEGNATLKVKTSDGKYVGECYIVVN